VLRASDIDDSKLEGSKNGIRQRPTPVQHKIELGAIKSIFLCPSHLSSSVIYFLPQQAEDLGIAKNPNGTRLALAVPDVSNSKAQAGWLVTPQVLTYVNGGYSGTRFGSAGMVSAFNGAPALGAGGVQFATPAFTKSGWFIGGGYETPIAAFIPGIPTGLFWRTEYRYESYNSSSLTDCAGVPSAATCDNSITFRPTNQTIVSELVWRFNWAAPGVHW